VVHAEPHPLDDAQQRTKNLELRLGETLEHFYHEASSITGPFAASPGRLGEVVTLGHLTSISHPQGDNPTGSQALRRG
jgi:hypothetical protein